jgi:hypothetical protein
MPDRRNVSPDSRRCWSDARYHLHAPAPSPKWSASMMPNRPLGHRRSSAWWAASPQIVGSPDAGFFAWAEETPPAAKVLTGSGD